MKPKVIGAAILANIRKELKQKSDPKIKEGSLRFFKEAIKPYGVKSAVVWQISKKYFRLIKDKSKSEIFALCEELWKSGYMEESFVACDFSYEIHKSYESKDFKVFENWVIKYVSNWASCDTLCNHTVGAFIEMYPAYLKELKKWAKSSDRWSRRAAAVSLIIPARHGRFLKDIFEISGILLKDHEDLVQKGYGWMLKAASESHQRPVFNYVMKNKNKMPRTALRYAIEKMPKNLKAKAMAK